MKTKFIFGLLVVCCLGGWGPFHFFIYQPNNERFASTAWVDREVQIINSQADNIDMRVLKLSLQAYVRARQQGLDDKRLLTIIDYSKPSSERRLWVVDIKNGKVLFNTWVAHGKNSGNVMATSFSNRPGSLKSSIGVFLTHGQPYNGGNGYSLRLAGLEHGVNDNAYNRAIVVHGAWYADPDVIKRYGQLGRSWGCPAVSLDTARPLINTIKDNTLVLMYYPDQKWMKHSTYLAG